jgi:hypothetical protein
MAAVRAVTEPSRERDPSRDVPRGSCGEAAAAEAEAASEDMSQKVALSCISALVGSLL